MANRNVKTIKINIPNQVIVDKINKIPMYKNLIRGEMVLGENIERVNHYQFSRINQLFTSLGVSVEEVI